MSTVTITINGQICEVADHATVLEACKSNNIDIPTLCYLKDINETGACRMCVVEIEGARNLQASCMTKVRQGMNIRTNSARVKNSRKTTLELLLANHNKNCLVCTRNGSCELQTLAERFQIKDIYFDKYEKRKNRYDDSSPSIIRDMSKCILCGRCLSVCKKEQGVSVLTYMNRGFETTVGTAFNYPLEDAGCLYCGQCINVCPTGALKEKSHAERVADAIADKNKFVVVQTAPAVRAALAEEFGQEIGTRATGKMAAAIRRLGIDKVFDTNFAADLTIMEEGQELLNRIKSGGVLPMFTSCSPGWVRLVEQYYPEFIPNLSSCKSPHQMFGAVIKSYYAAKMQINPESIFVVSVMPCTCKKSEMDRPDMEYNHLRDVDAVLTTREVAKMIKEAGIDFMKLADEDFDHPLGDSTGASVIFGATGGVMEAALRTVADLLENSDLTDFEYKAVRGVKGIKEASITLGGNVYNVAVAHGGANARKLLEMIQSGEKTYHFVEIMGCNGGCVNGGGQPFVSAQIKNSGLDIRARRASALYDEDKLKLVRKSHQNEEVLKLYRDYLGSPASHKAHELLHTVYHKHDVFPHK